MRLSSGLAARREGVVSQRFGALGAGDPDRGGDRLRLPARNSSDVAGSTWVTGLVDRCAGDALRAFGRSVSAR